MRTLREGESVINLPEPGSGREVDIEGAQQALRCAPGCLAVEMDPPREAHGELFIPDAVQGRLRADCGTVIAASRRDENPEIGDCRSGKRAEVMPKPGSRVLVRPYHGLWIEPFQSTEPAVLTMGRLPWRCHGRNVAVNVDAAPSGNEILTPNDLETGPRATGRVVGAGPDTWPAIGSRVAFSRFHPRTARQGLDEIEPGIVMVEERQLYATLGPSDYRAGQVRIYGAGTDWRSSILMVEDGGRWRPIAPWVEIERDLCGDGVQLPELLAARRRIFATTVSGGMRSGARVIVDPSPAGAITFELGDMGRERQLVLESSIWAVLE